ncbi:MAG: DUF3987 domain-containing protein [Gemmataceae bacterium]|nr:DUF3987 domain-containing protein [Gemmataceae bacterium]
MSRFTTRAVGGFAQRLGTDEARRAIALLATPGEGCQLTEIPTGRRQCLDGADVEGLVAAAAGLTEGRWLYLRLNPVPAGLVGNTVVADVLRRRWLTLDVDALRPNASKESATDAEHEAARAGAEKARAYLTARGWPPAVVVDTGNGWQSLYRIDLPNDDGARALLRAVLQAVKLAVGELPGAVIDTATFKATQEVKLPGSWARKGADTKERPWRQVRLAEVPDPVQVVPFELLHAIAAPLIAAAPEVPPPPSPLPPASRFGARMVGNGHGPHPYAQRVFDAEVAKLAGTSEGQRNEQAYQSAAAVGNYIESGNLYLPEVRLALIQAATGTGLPAREATSAVDRGLNDGQAKPKAIPTNGHHANGHAHANGTATPEAPEPWPQPIPLTEAPPVPAFPLDTLPALLARFVTEAAWATNAPPDFVAVPLLATAAAAIGNSHWLAVTRTHRQPPVLFAGVVARPGAGKSAPFDLAKEPLEQAERRYYKEWLAAKRAGGRDEPAPHLRRCLLDDTTTEGMIRVLEDNPRGLLRACDELSAVVTGMNQYKEGGKGSDRQVYLKIWSGSTIKVDRKLQDGIPLVVRRPLVCIVGGIQPQVIEWMRGQQQGDRPPPDDGFLDRFLLSYPDELPASGERWRDVSDEAYHGWDNVIKRLLALPMADLDGDPAPNLTPLSASGKDAWTLLTQAHADETNAADFPEWLRGCWSKLVPGYAGRLALVLHLLRWACDEAGDTAVDGESVEQAFRLVEYFKAHARKVYATMGADPRVPAAKRILRWLGEHRDVTTISRSDLYYQLRGSFASPEAIGGPLWLLTQHRYVRVIQASSKSGPGRKPTPLYEINPLWGHANNANNANNAINSGGDP